MHYLPLVSRLPCRSISSISALQAAFRNPASPFHIPPGTQGPASPDEPPASFTHSSAEAVCRNTLDAGEKAQACLTALGYDPASFWEQNIVWGDQDSFQHVNNVHYVRFLESGRIKWMMSLAEELGGPTKANDMLNAKGISLILKSISVNFKRPVTFPDTLLIAHKPYYPPGKPSTPTHFNCLAVAYSYAQRTIVTESDATLVWYNYDRLQKANPGEAALDILRCRMNLGKLEGSTDSG